MPITALEPRLRVTFSSLLSRAMILLYFWRLIDPYCRLTVDELLPLGNAPCQRRLSINCLIIHGIRYTSTTVHSSLHQDHSAGQRRSYLLPHWRCIGSACRLFFISSSLWASLLTANCYRIPRFPSLIGFVLDSSYTVLHSVLLILHVLPNTSLYIKLGMDIGLGAVTWVAGSMHGAGLAVRATVDPLLVYTTTFGICAQYNTQSRQMAMHLVVCRVSEWRTHQATNALSCLTHIQTHRLLPSELSMPTRPVDSVLCCVSMCVLPPVPSM